MLSTSLHSSELRVGEPNFRPASNKVMQFGEGGIMAPTTGEKEMKLEAVRENFGE
jgi:hypothetical protein